MASKFPDNPIARLRIAVRKTGEEFATALGLSVGAVRNMERGVLTPGEETRERMFITFGVDSDSLVNAKGPLRYAVGGGPYTWESYLDWRELTKVDDAKAKEIIETEVRRLRWFLRAAALNGSLFSVKFRLETMLEEIAKQEGIIKLIESFMREDGCKESWFRFDMGTIGVVDHVLKQLDIDPSGKSSAEPPPDAAQPGSATSGGN